ncbi:hypothetical protein EDB83DRAFT_2552254 [Lactarius deliciosus]|nr:hypothetical protein EDB83DRAFT_2552254 [Lactarius deliciosus]
MSFESPPESEASSPMASSAVENLLLQLQPLFESRAQEVEMEGVTPALLEELSAYMIDTDHAGLWESLRLDFRPNKLILRLPSLENGLISNLLIVAISDAPYQDCYGRSSTVLIGGSTDINYLNGNGCKSPDFSLYELKGRRDGARSITDSADSGIPTIVFEATYGQSTRCLASEAARHICLTMGQVLLVVAIDITHEPNTRPKKLQSVTWSHWEEDIKAQSEITKQDGDRVYEVEAERSPGVSATAFKALIPITGPDDDQLLRIRVTETFKWELFPSPKISRIDILHRHLYRDPKDADVEVPAFSFSVSDIMTVIKELDYIQEQIDSITPEILIEAGVRSAARRAKILQNAVS